MNADYGAARVPPGEDDVELLLRQWRQWLPSARKFLPAAWDYLAASLWRRIGLRMNEARMLDLRDWRRDLGEYGSVHVRFGKGSRGRGAKTRLVPAISSTSAGPAPPCTGGRRPAIRCGRSDATTSATPYPHAAFRARAR